eukprot:6143110-Pleurochrysis_carterae.AAC.2
MHRDAGSRACAGTAAPSRLSTAPAATWRPSWRWSGAPRCVCLRPRLCTRANLASAAAIEVECVITPCR